MESRTSKRQEMNLLCAEKCEQEEKKCEKERKK